MNMRSLPSVDRLLQIDSAADLIVRYGRPLLVEAVRESIDSARASLQNGGEIISNEGLIAASEELLESWLSSTLQPVINATGVVIHTNLGRSPLSQAAIEAIRKIAQGYSTIEYDLDRGKRGKREQHCEILLRQITHAEAGIVVNNNAAAILLSLTALAKRKTVLISRSQLIEIGGGFRIPDVLKQSGAKLIEVGTTNRTHLHDFESAIETRTALILLAHHSNFKIVGFTTEPSLDELVSLGKRFDIPVLHDLGSGALLDTAQFGMAHEPTVQESIAAGAQLVAFSGDKLLGGPQAGILVGKKSLIDKLRVHPLARAVRPDKIALAALVATLQHYLKNEALQEIPIWQMIAADEQVLKQRAEHWVETIGAGEVAAGASTVGGGSLPEETQKTWHLKIVIPKPDHFTKRLRQWHVPIIARIEDNHVLLDPRTVLPSQEEELLRALATLLSD
ncbi:MAG: L-seryl-tRNA(Sec) selenium transferase [Chloroflexi bacterium]|nr:L-seryl-tRNA(Sec) selenium transferase [Chloroflexota bacterium]